MQSAETDAIQDGGTVRTLRLPPTPRNLQGLIVPSVPPAGTDEMQYREDILARFGVTLREDVEDGPERQELIDLAWAALPWA